MFFVKNFGGFSCHVQHVVYNFFHVYCWRVIRLLHTLANDPSCLVDELRPGGPSIALSRLLNIHQVLQGSKAGCARRFAHSYWPVSGRAHVQFFCVDEVRLLHQVGALFSQLLSNLDYLCRTCFWIVPSAVVPN